MYRERDRDTENEKTMKQANTRENNALVRIIVHRAKLTCKGDRCGLPVEVGKTALVGSIVG